MEQFGYLEGRIPKVIHYCWFGRGEKSELMQKCMASWKQHCPDWVIIEWNEDNFDVNFCPYAAKAYREKRWGFLSDVARLQIIYNHGGVYLDTDVELRCPIDALLDNGAWFGYGSAAEINTGSGFGAIKGHPFVQKLLNQYLAFKDEQQYEVCTVLDTKVFKSEFPDFAADHDVRQQLGDVLIIENIWHYVIHHYTNTWMTPRQKWMSKSKLIGFIRKLLKR